MLDLALFIVGGFAAAVAAAFLALGFNSLASSPTPFRKALRAVSKPYSACSAIYGRARSALTHLRALRPKPSPSVQANTQIPIPAPPPRPTAEQTREAQRLLRNADEIYRQARALSERHQSKIGPYFEQYRETIKLLDYAAQDTVRARNLDPGARVPLKDDTGSFFQCDADWMAGRLLYHEAVLSTSTNHSEAAIREGITCLKKYLIYRPYDADGYRLLAKAYTRVYERQNALEAIKKAAELSPDDVEVRRVQDALNNPEIGTREPNTWHIDLLWSFSPLLVPAGIVMLFTSLAPIGFAIAIAGGILWWARNRSDNHKIFANAFNKAAGIEPPKRTL